MDNKLIRVDKEFIEILEKLELKVKQATWEGIDKLDYPTLTRILARKINATNIV